MIDLEGFQLVSHLGTGGMASVWRARQRSLDRDVAIKMLSAKFASTPDDVARFQMEARTAGRLKHPGIVQVYDAIFQNGVYCFVMELVDGYTVGDWVRRKGHLTEKEALVIADCVADALEYAWKQFGMVHCDIKPDNVMVDADGTVKLTDLGLSRTVSALRSVAPKDDEEVFGTPAYISPEQAMGEPDLDCRADMYSLGAMLYHLATGQMLFQGQPDEKVMELQVSERVPCLRTLMPTLSVPFCDLVEKLLAKDRKHRQADWHQVRADIAAVRAHRPLPSGALRPEACSTVRHDSQRAAAVAHAASALTEAPPSNRSHIRVIFAVLLVVAAVVGLAVWYSPPAPPAVPSAPRTPIPTRVAALLTQAQEWAAQNADRTVEVVERYQAVVDAAPKSPEAAAARAAMAQARDRAGRKCAEVLTTLETRTAPWVSSGQFANAIAAYEEYSGPFAAETRPQRLRRAEDLRSRKRAAEELAATEQAEREAAARRKAADDERRESERQGVAALLDALTAQGVVAAKERADQLAVERPDVVGLGAVVELRNIVNGAFEAERAVLQSFVNQIGQPIELRTRSGSVVGKVNHVNWATGDILIARQISTSMIDVKVNVRDLTLPDRLRRMGSEDTPGIRLAKALLSIENGAYDFAREQLTTLPESLKERVLGTIPAGR